MKALPCSVAVSGKEYPINADFKTWVRVSCVMEDDGKTPEEKVAYLFQMAFYGKDLPDDFNQALPALADFYFSPMKCGKNGKSGEKVGKAEKAEKAVLSFVYDAPLIYDAFLSQYGVDLFRDNPHWHVFCAMLSGLCGNHKILDVIKFRRVNPGSIPDKKKRAFYRKMKSIYALPDRRDVWDIEKDNIRALDALFGEN